MLHASIVLSPLKGAMILALPLSLVMQLVDLHFGGTGNGLGGRNTASPAEEQLFSRIVDEFSGLLAPAWAEVQTIAPAHHASGDGEHADIGPCAVHPLLIEIGNIQHEAAFLHPLSLIRAVPQLLTEAEGRQDISTVDPIWQRRLSQVVMNVHLPVRTIFARPELPLTKLMTLMPGDIIPICLPNHVPVTVAGRQFAHGSVGEANGRVAVKIDTIEQGYAA